MDPIYVNDKQYWNACFSWRYCVYYCRKRSCWGQHITTLPILSTSPSYILRKSCSVYFRDKIVTNLYQTSNIQGTGIKPNSSWTWWWWWWWWRRRWLYRTWVAKQFLRGKRTSKLLFSFCCFFPNSLSITRNFQTCNVHVGPSEVLSIETADWYEICQNYFHVLLKIFPTSLTFWHPSFTFKF